MVGRGLGAEQVTNRSVERWVLELEAGLGQPARCAATTGQGKGRVGSLGTTALIDQFPAGAMTAEVVQRAVSMGLVRPTDEGKVRVTDRRFLETGSALAHLGIPVSVILDEWQALVAHTNDIAARFIALFETFFAPADWRHGLTSDGAVELARMLAQLQSTARQVLLAAVDDSLARRGRERLGELID